MAALYIHIPFCVRKCTYCDFASYACRESDFERYYVALKEEIASARERWGQISLSSIFIGGGTPTIFPPEYLAAILQETDRCFHIDADAEITVEGNPGTVTKDKLRVLRAAGVNRLSFGAQTFSPDLLKMLGRIHTAEEIVRTVEMSRQAGFENINLDLMYALPGQSEQDWEDTLKAAAGLRTEHLSCYSLIPEEGTPLTRRIDRGELSLPDDETTVRMQHNAERFLVSQGYHRYEISNYAREGFESRHNKCYWQRGDYLGFGSAAHSLMNGMRFHNPDSIDEYLAGARGLDVESLTRDDEIEEAVMLGTRLCEGIDIGEFDRRYSADFRSLFGKGISSLIEGGFALIDGDRFRLTQRGLDVQSRAVLELIENMQTD